MPVALPTDRTKPTADLSQQTILAYGPPKIGTPGSQACGGFRWRSTARPCDPYRRTLRVHTKHVSTE